MPPASTTAGSSTGGAGRGSIPLKTWGRPLSSRTAPTLPMTSPGGGSTSRSHRTATDRPAIPATTGRELVARSPPTSQVTRTTCAAPSIAPRALSIPPPTPPTSSLRIRAPTLEPIAWAMATIRKAPPIATKARAGCSSPARALTSCGASATMRTTATPTAASPRTCGIAPDRKPISAPMIASTSTMRSIVLIGRRSIAGIVRDGPDSGTMAASPGQAGPVPTTRPLAAAALPPMSRRPGVARP